MFFVRKLLRNVCLCLLIAASVWTATLLCDRQRLNEELIRLHVVAASDSEEDQRIKLRVRDAILESIREDLEQVKDVETAKAYLRDNLQKIEAVANGVLAKEGTEDSATVSLCREAFDIRRYDTFSLPAGVYEALRVTIGEGSGKNWWCVAFPNLCIGATTAEFEAVAAGAGFSETLSETLEGEEGYRIRFYLLDLLGRVQNMLWEE